MTQISPMRLSLFALIALQFVTFSYAQEQQINGQTYQLEKNQVHAIEFLSKECATRLLPACPPAPPLAPVGIVPTQSSSALPGAFFPAAALNIPAAPPQIKGTVFVAGDQSTNASFVGTPPDANIGVGPQQIVLASTATITSFTKTGARDNVLDVEPSSFLNLDGDFNTIANASEPRIYFDQQSNLFYYIALNADGTGSGVNNGFSVAVSDSNILTNATAWTVLTIFDATLVPDADGCAGDQNTSFDFPTLGMDQNALYTSLNIFDGSGNYLSTTLFVIQKSSLLTPGPVFVTVFRDVPGIVGEEFPYRQAGSSIVPALNFDANPLFGYYLATDPFLFGKLNLYRVINPGSTSPTLSTALSINVPATSSSAVPCVPFAGNLFGSLGVLQVSDDRIMTPIVRNGQLYATHAIMVNTTGVADTTIGDPAARSAARWYQISLNPGTTTETATTSPSLIQAGTLFDNAVTNPLWYNMPSLMVNQRGDLAIGFTVSSNVLAPSAGFVGRLASTPLGSLLIGGTPPNTYASGSGQYSRMLGTATPSTGQPWGLYSNISIDPTDNMTMWTVQEIAKNSLEQVVVAQLLAP